MDIKQEDYYACQMKVPQFGAEGQKLLENSSCLIIGMGGLGCPVAQYFLGSGIGRIGICDNDKVELSNINRQIFYTQTEIGSKKIACASKYMKDRNPFVEIVEHDCRLNENNWKKIIPAYDIVVDCTDNFYTKYLIHDACLILKKNLIQGGVFQKSGQIYYFPFADNEGGQISCLRCIWSDIPGISSQVDCTMAGVMTALVGTIGVQCANVVLLSIMERLEKKSFMTIFDWESLSWQNLDIPQKTNCPCCLEETSMQKLSYLYETAIELESYDENTYITVDVRNEVDHDNNSKFKSAEKVLRLSEYFLNNFDEFGDTLQRNKRYVLVCYKGIRSLELARKLRARGIETYSFIGGYANL